MEAEIKHKLNTTTFKKTGKSGGGCVSSGNAYETDNGIVFVKSNRKAGSNIMFKGEYLGLEHLRRNNFPAPKPILHGPTYLVSEYVEMRPLKKYSEELGTILANLHKLCSHDQFGFDEPTCCGYLPLCNEWQDDWVHFFGSQRIQPLVDMIQEETGNRLIGELWSNLSVKLPSFFKDIQVTPSLLHGDLWSGNAAETEDGPITFDPAVFYGHSEFDLAIAKMFGGFSEDFYTAYHKILPQEKGFNDRQQLYILFHNLNHWAHFGSGYRDPSLRIMKLLLEKTFVC